MGLFRKKNDPISDRSKALNSEIASLEAQIKQLNSKIQNEQVQPRTRSTAFPSSQNSAVQTTSGAAPVSGRDPIFESVDRKWTGTPWKPKIAPAISDDLEVGKNQFERGLRRLARVFHAPPARNPKLVSYLAAGSIKGLRPLRYEKRIARNRTIALSIILVLLLWGIYAAFVRQS